MKFNVAKTLGVTVLTGGLVIAGLSWTGGDILDGAKAKLNEMGSSITLFKNNETKMKDKIVEMKSTIKGLEEALANGEGNATELQKEIDRLKGEVAKMEEELTKRQTEITRLEGELNLANEQANALKVAMDGITTETPMTEEEMNSLLDGTVVTPPTNPDGGDTGTEEGEVIKGTWNLNDSMVYESKYIKLELTENPDLGGGITYTLSATNKTNGAQFQQPIKVNQYKNGVKIPYTEMSLMQGATNTIEFDKASDEIKIESNIGTEIENIIIITGSLK